MKSIRFIAVLLLTMGFLIPFSMKAQTLEVCGGCTYSGLKEAVAKAQKNDTVLVKKGVYREIEIKIDKPLTLLGEPGAVIDGENKSEILLVEADSVTIDGLEIINVGKSHMKDYSAIRAKRIKHFKFQNLTIRNPYFAIYLEKSENGKILNNKVYGEAVNEYNAGNGIHIWYSHRLEVKNNETYNMRDGIYLEFSDDNHIENNISQGHVRYGLHFMFSQSNQVIKNAFINNGAGIAIMFSKHMKMLHNTFKDNWGAASYGVLLKEATDSELNYNVFERNTTGINVEGSNRISYFHNDFKGNGWAIRSRGANYQNTFKDNNFLDNSFDLSFKGNLAGNSFNGNYWSEYTGYDLDKDGVGDVPYRPVKLFSSVVDKSPEAIILLRSMFIDIVDFAEKVSPVFTPSNLLDNEPQMKMIRHD